MVISEIGKTELLIQIRQDLLNEGDLDLSDSVLLASCVRRIAGFRCPCAVTTLVNTMSNSFRYLVDNAEVFEKKIEGIVERLIIGGDLLELNDVTTNPLTAKSTWLFPAHPSFLDCLNGTILIFGIAPDENVPAPFLSSCIKYKGCKRYIDKIPADNIVNRLVEFGLFPTTREVWLKQPKKTSPSALISEMNGRLLKAPLSGDIANLSVLNLDTSNQFYRSRWSGTDNLSGHFIAKRPFIYGQSIWCYVELKDGKIIRFVDIPLKMNGVSQRGCDGAWQIQMAIDFLKGIPQYYTIQEIEEGSIFRFHFPIPMWAERRLIAMGEPVESPGCLFAYMVAKEDQTFEEQFLNEYLWLTRKY